MKNNEAKKIRQLLFLSNLSINIAQEKLKNFFLELCKECEPYEISTLDGALKVLTKKQSDAMIEFCKQVIKLRDSQQELITLRNEVKNYYDRGEEDWYSLDSLHKKITEVGSLMQELEKNLD